MINWKIIDIKKLAAIVAASLQKNGIDALLVGGACVSIYSKNKYLSHDLDFVTHASIKEISAVLREIGFEREHTRHFVRKDCPFFIEFVAPPAAIGNEPVRRKNELRTKLGTILLLTPTDCVKDRLSAYYHWNDPQSLDQACLVSQQHKINYTEISRWSEKEGFKDRYILFRNTIRRKLLRGQK